MANVPMLTGYFVIVTAPFEAHYALRTKEDALDMLASLFANSHGDTTASLRIGMVPK